MTDKWDVSTTALKSVLGDFDDKVEFGLSLFPQTQANCSDGADLAGGVAPSLNGFDAIKTKLDANEPFTRNGYTPIGQSLAEVASLPAFADATKRRYVIMFTDGVQDCPLASDIWGTSTLVSKVTALRNKGIKTFIIGFGSTSGGDGVRAYALNQMAYAGGTGRTNCNKDGSNPNADDTCYYQADTAGELAAAFEEIAVVVSDDPCDGKDNDCDGLTDEDAQDHACSSACGTGVQKCVNGAYGTCSAVQPQTEVCDGKDNDCDGNTDEGCACKNGETRPCGKDTGECELGTQTCVNGQWNMCTGGKGPSAEICDNKDNDCDGFTDPDCDCTSGQTEVCGGPNVGQCHTGTKSCSSGSWGDCVGAVGPSPEVCDGIDNDCDGLTDEGGIGDDDDVSNNLCDASHICQNGQCVLGMPFEKPPTMVVPSGEPAGCACRTGGTSGSTSPLGGLFLAAALAGILVARRRK